MRGTAASAPVRHVPSAGVSRRVPRPDYSASGSPGVALPPNTFGRSSPRECHAPPSYVTAFAYELTWKAGAVVVSKECP
ncbi:hypothetical protein NDU88_002385 [Pleurodeles waltl]|uniref:Uncharacterized protein n=1 Tax=Pleurodeles waltl TaxID=8319 RepID=A0AAV7RF94_PLEWA|nr:hypothetical protein NDU88_002385 [Pleurodeles waltl]